MGLILPKQLDVCLEARTAYRQACHDYLQTTFLLSPKETVFCENPVTIREFVESKEHLGISTLTERQYQVFEFMFGENPRTIFENKNQLAVIAWGKGCLAGDTEIILADGTRTTVEKCIAPTTVSSLNSAGNIVIGQSTEFFKKGQEPLYLVTTSTGKKVRVTGEHKFLSTSGWISLKDLTIGSWICSPAKIQLPNIPGVVNIDFSRIAGYLLGDGHIANSCTELIASNPEIINDFCARVKALGCEYKIRNQYYEDGRYKTSHIFVLKSKGRGFDFEKQLVELGLRGKKSGEKRIPAVFFKADVASRIALLEGLYATDGWVCKKGSYFEVGYGSKSFLLVRDIQDLLLSFGILSAIRNKHIIYKGERRLYYQLILRNKSDAVKFFTALDVPGKEKYRTEILNSANKTHGSGRICPRELLNKLGDIDKYPNDIKKHITYLQRRNLGARQETLYSWAIKFGLIDLAQVTSPDVCWETITEISPSGIDDFFTPTVKEHETYVASGLLHHNSGKDLVAAICLIYAVYILLCMEDPALHFKLIPGDTIDCVNVAPSGKNADTVFFEKLKQMLRRWKWLNDKFLIKESNAFVGRVPLDNTNEQVVSITKDGIIFPKRIRLHSRNSNNESAEGLNTILWVMDEASAFKNKREESNAGKIYGVLRSSASTRFATKNKGFIISYPREKNDFILTTYEKNLSKLHVFTDRAATWEVRGREIFSAQTFKYGNHDVPLDFKSHFDDNPSEAAGMYLAEPPDAEHGFIEYPEKVQANVDERLVPAVKSEEYVNGNKICRRINGILGAKYNTDYILTLDLGHKRDRACLSMFHREDDGDSYKIVQDLVVGWTPRMADKKEVSFINVEKFIRDLSRQFNIVGVYFDQFQSVQMSEQLTQSGIPAFTYYLDKEDYMVFKELLYSKRFRLQNFQIQINEINTLIETRNRVDHRSNGSKDFADTIVGAAKVLLEKHKFTGNEDFPDVEAIDENLGRQDPWT